MLLCLQKCCLLLVNRGWVTIKLIPGCYVVNFILSSRLMISFLNFLALRSVAEAIFASQMDHDEGHNDGFVIKVEWKLSDRKVTRKIGEGTGDIEVIHLFDYI